MTKTFGKGSEADEFSQSLHYSKTGRFVAKALQNVSKTLVSIPNSTSDLRICWF